MLDPRSKPAAERICVFDACDGSGFIVDEQTNTAQDCACRAQRIARARTAHLEGRLPKLFRGVSFDRPPLPEITRTAPNQVQEVRRYVRNISEHLDQGRGMWFWGDVGTGKTTLAMIISKAAIDAGRSVAIYSLPRLLNLLRESLQADGGLTDLLDRLSVVDLLHIDDLGAENQTDWVLEQLYSIVNSRYEAQRAIVATTNLQPEALSERLGDRTVSRLVEICRDPIVLAGDDKRREYRAERTEVAQPTL